jgi:GTP cyclohydrolase I
VEFFSKRPQVQERLTEQIAAAISFVADTPDVAVYLEAVHFCVKSRGIQDAGSSTCTLAVDGLFADTGSEVRREFLNIARGLSILN